MSVEMSQNDLTMNPPVSAEAGMEVEVCDCFVYLRIDAPRIDETQTACSSFFALEGQGKKRVSPRLC